MQNFKNEEEHNKYYSILKRIEKHSFKYSGSTEDSDSDSNSDGSSDSDVGGCEYTPAILIELEALTEQLVAAKKEGMASIAKSSLQKLAVAQDTKTSIHGTPLYEMYIYNTTLSSNSNDVCLLTVYWHHIPRVGDYISLGDMSYKVSRVEFAPISNPTKIYNNTCEISIYVDLQ